MSSGALFGNNVNRGASKNLVEFKAGKMTMKGSKVYPDNRKGQLYVYQSDDCLMHFCWKDRTSGVVEDDLIIFPDDCEFKHVPQCTTGRVYLLKFKSSSRRFFFWLQDLKTDKDDEHCRKINEVLNNPPTPGSQRSGGANPEGDLQNLLNNMSQQQLIQLFGGVGQIGGLGNLLGTMNRPHGTARTTTTTSSTPVATTIVTRPPAAQTPAPTATASAGAATTETSRSTGGSKTSSRTAAPASGTEDESRTPIRVSDLVQYLSEIPTPSEGRTDQRGVASELSSSIPGAISSTENLELEMKEHLPPGDNLNTTLSSPQFSQALSMFWSALQSGQAGPVIRQFGLGTQAVNAATNGNLEQFVSALEFVMKDDQEQEQRSEQGKDDKSKKQPPSGAGSTDKKDEDDEGMCFD
ncbi:proteasomal ubiquitin receptor ADRM1 isoform X1 [Leptopilina heterotoma]|uniref:proteasomal ubiquitin receptor ADRM1 isoform X1 n=1 Tax=Leptopilina heterotoma TaxID=63436 RepID=UPI001CA81209|nr:proteasomal ubiquitin receptor ADRM1 isoform X1 [Leptopilina heterotoma]